MPSVYKILILGASYGSLLGAKIALAGHDVKLVCLPEEVELINSEGAKVRMAARGVEGLVELNTKVQPLLALKIQLEYFLMASFFY